MNDVFTDSGSFQDTSVLEKKKKRRKSGKKKTNALHEINLKTSETKVNRIQVFITLIMCKICLKLQLLQRRKTSENIIGTSFDKTSVLQWI